MAKHFFLFLLISHVGTMAFCQANDNTGKDLFTVKNTSSFSFPISSTGFSINYTRPFTPADSIPISADKYAPLVASGNTHVIHPSPSEYYLLRPHHNQLTTYYLKDVMNANLDTLLLKRPALLRKALDILNKHVPFTPALSAGDSSKLLLDVFNERDTVTYRQLLDTLNSYGLTNGFYNTTDVGIWYKPAFVNLKVSNLSFGTLSDFFTPNNQPTLQVELGFIANSTLKFDNWQNLSRARRPGFLGRMLGFHQYDLFYSVFVNTSCITYYDTYHHERFPTDWFAVPKFAQIGVKGDANLYYSKIFAVALTGTLFNGLPLDNDKGFQSKPSSRLSPLDTSVFAAGKAAGKYGGNINDRPWNARVSVAVPIFLNFFGRLNDKKKGTGSVYLLPSYAPFGPLNGHWTNQLGLSVNLLGKPYGGINSSIVQAGGVGCDILSDPTKHTNWGAPIYYVSGTINLNSIISQKGKVAAR